MFKKYRTNRDRIRVRIRARVKGTQQKPRLSVFRSNQHLYLQLVDDESGRTLCSASDREVSLQKGATKTQLSQAVGSLLAQKALKIKKEQVVFDRSGYQYHGRVRAAAEGSREGGLKF